MSGGVKLVWHGDRLLAKVAGAVAAAIDETTEEAAREAAASHWWRSRRRHLESSITNERAVARGRRVRGRFGAVAQRGFYGLFLERRTPFLRPAADRHFPRLASRIRRRLG